MEISIRSLRLEKRSDRSTSLTLAPDVTLTRDT